MINAPRCGLTVKQMQKGAKRGPDKALRLFLR